MLFSLSSALFFSFIRMSLFFQDRKEINAYRLHQDILVMNSTSCHMPSILSRMICFWSRYEMEHYWYTWKTLLSFLTRSIHYCKWNGAICPFYGCAFAFPRQRLNVRIFLHHFISLMLSIHLMDENAFAWFEGACSIHSEACTCISRVDVWVAMMFS